MHHRSTTDLGRIGRNSCHRTCVPRHWYRSGMTIAAPEQPPPARSAIGDDVLIERLRDGDTTAGDALVDRYAAPLLRYLRRVARDASTAEELHQATWLSALEHLDQFDTRTARSGASGFKSWLFRIAANKTHDHFRRSGRQRRHWERVSGDPRFTDPATGNTSADGDTLLVREQAEQLARLVDDLPDAQAEVVRLRFFGGLKFVEIAETLGCPLNTALGRMHKAMAKLRVAMAAETQ
jgi:RNA polymerase sigma-70 factor (ECF subfamily)